jgi:hypothetical protein
MSNQEPDTDERDADRADDERIEIDEQLPGSRRGMPVRERIREPDSYGLLFVGLIGVIVVSAGLGSYDFGRAVTFVLMGIVLLFALRTSRAHPRLIAFAIALFPVMIVIATAGVILGERAFSVEIVAGLIVLAHVAVLVAILRRMATHLVVSWQTVMAALSIYLLIGMSFAALFGFLGAIYPEGIFAGNPTTTTVDYLYFSFITMTTVGYGDFTPGPDSIRMLAVTEALVGQIFLVTALALLVGNLGRERRRPANERRRPDRDR